RISCRPHRGFGRPARLTGGEEPSSTTMISSSADNSQAAEMIALRRLSCRPNTGITTDRRPAAGGGDELSVTMDRSKGMARFGRNAWQSQEKFHIMFAMTGAV